MKSEEKEVVLTPEAKRVVDFLIRVKFSTAAKATGLSTAALYNIKSGRNNASKDVIFALEKAFPNDPEASFSWLHDGVMPEETTTTKPQPIDPGAASDGYNPLKEAYEQLMRRVADLEQWNSDLKADKRNLQEQIQNMWQSMGIIRQAQAADDQPKGSANFQIGKNSGRTGLEVVSPKRTINREHLVLGGRLLTVAVAR